MPQPHLHAAAPAALPPRPGETPMPNAPQVRLRDGRSCIPQHYLQYQQTLETLGEIISQIDYDEHMPVFADSDAHGLYLQVGLVGRENYERTALPRPWKLVYGRRWRIEPYTPSSEVIQTVLLALKKACEHEVRELLTLRDAATGLPATPFSCHQDLPLLANHRDMLGAADAADAAADHGPDAIAGWLAALRYDQRAITLLGANPGRNGSLIVDLALGAAPPARQREGGTAQYDGLELTLVLRQPRRTELLHALMAALVAHSDRHVEEHFRYLGFARFGRGVDPAALAALSLASRPYARDLRDDAFAPVFRQINEQVDARRAPALGSGALAARNQKKLAGFGTLAGHLPRGYAAPNAIAG